WRDSDSFLRLAYRDFTRADNRHSDFASHASSEIRNECPRISREGMGRASRTQERDALLPELLPSRTNGVVRSAWLVDRAGRLLPMGTWYKGRSILPCASRN